MHKWLFIVLWSDVYLNVIVIKATAYDYFSTLTYSPSSWVRHKSSTIGLIVCGVLHLAPCQTHLFKKNAIALRLLDVLGRPCFLLTGGVHLRSVWDLGLVHSENMPKPSDARTLDLGDHLTLCSPVQFIGDFIGQNIQYMTKLLYKRSFVVVLYCLDFQTSLANASLSFPNLAFTLSVQMRLPRYVKLLTFQWFIIDFDWCIRDGSNALNFNLGRTDVQAHLHGEAIQPVALFFEMFWFLWRLQQGHRKSQGLQAVWRGATGCLLFSTWSSQWWPGRGCSLPHIRLYREPFWRAFDLPVEQPHTAFLVELRRIPISIKYHCRMIS